ncbi:helix-turn-helix domain-containing protein [Streptomyces sp. NPDC059697]|uniref:helix-turn-helix domain-containing protein n=1 Tax=Streptomyces sp. NPDC059697 TaxID=3346912 RepID=UPI003696DB8D
MPVAVARPIAPTPAERERLKKMAYGHKTEHRLRMRAQVVLHAARGRSNARIARETGLHVDTVCCWRRRFAERGLAGLTDRKRSGRPPAFTPLQTAQVKALACQLPAETGVPLARWSCPELAREAMQRGIAPFVSACTVRRWLANDALKPWQHRSWIFITDLAQVGDRIRAFGDRYNATAQPFQWKFTTSDLDDLLARLDQHTAGHQEQPSLALTA